MVHTLGTQGQEGDGHHVLWDMNSPFSQDFLPLIYPFLSQAINAVDAFVKCHSESPHSAAPGESASQEMVLTQLAG